MVKTMHVMITLLLISGPALADYIKYDANELPDKADPAWERSGDLGNSKIIVDTQNPNNNLLHLVSPPGNKLTFKMLWDAKDDKGATVVTRFKLNAGAGFIALDNGTVWESFEVNPDEAYGLFSGLHKGINPTQWHTYRLTLEKGIFSIYLDEKPLDANSQPIASGNGLPATGSGAPPNAIQIGQSTTLAGGVPVVDELDWLIDYVYFDPNGISLMPEISYAVSPEEKLATSWAKIKLGL